MSVPPARRAGILPLAMSLILLAACSAVGGPTPTGPGTSAPASPPSTGTAIDHPADPHDLVLRIDTDGGFVAPGFLLTHLPEYSLFGDGRVVVPGPQVAIYPGPALPNLVSMRVSEAGMQRILRAAQAAGLFGPDRHYDATGIADAPTTTFTLVAGGATHVISAYALGMDAGAPAAGLDAVGRAALRDLRDRLTATDDWLDDAVVEPEAPFAFGAIRVYADHAQPGPQGGVEPSHTAWPLATSLGDGTPAGGGANGRCTLVSGADLAVLLPVLRQSNELTIWRSGGLDYQVRLRPLLPDESGCRVIGQ